MCGIRCQDLAKPRRMRCKAYGSHLVCVSVTTLAATYLVYNMSKVR